MTGRPYGLTEGKQVFFWGMKQYAIKLRITLGFLCSIAIVAACVIGYAGWQMREDARGYFLTASGQQLRLMDENISSFVNAARHNAQMVAELPGLAEAKDIFPRFVDNPQESRYRQSDLSPEAQALTETLLRVGRANPDYLEIYVGYADGSYASSCDDMKIPAHHDLSTKEWYRRRAASPDKSGLAPAYFSVTGEMVVAVTHKLQDARGNLTGVVGIDISLAELSRRVAEMNFGKTGFFLIIEDSGRIICNPLEEEMVGKVIGKDVNTPALEAIMKVPNGVVDVEAKGQAYIANILTTQSGWKAVAMQSVREINERSNTAMQHVSLIAVVVALLMLGVALLIVRSIVRPLNALVQAQPPHLLHQLAQRAAGHHVGKPLGNDQQSKLLSRHAPADIVHRQGHGLADALPFQFAGVSQHHAAHAAGRLDLGHRHRLFQLHPGQKSPQRPFQSTAILLCRPQIHPHPVFIAAEHKRQQTVLCHHSRRQLLKQAQIGLGRLLLPKAGHTLHPHKAQLWQQTPVFRPAGIGGLSLPFGLEPAAQCPILLVKGARILILSVHFCHLFPIRIYSRRFIAKNAPAHPRSARTRRRILLHQPSIKLNSTVPPLGRIRLILLESSKLKLSNSSSAPMPVSILRRV